MTSKEALDRFMKTLCEYESDTNNKESVYSCWYRIIKQDLERLEKLEKEYKETRKLIKSWNKNGGELLRENAKLKKVIEIINQN